MKKLKLLALSLVATTLIAQQSIEPDYGLATTAAGMSVFTFGITMRPSLVVQQYNPAFGNNYVRYDSVDRQRVKTTTLIFGAITTVAGLVIQNIRRKKKKNV